MGLSGMKVCLKRTTTNLCRTSVVEPTMKLEPGDHYQERQELSNYRCCNSRGWTGDKNEIFCERSSNTVGCKDQGLISLWYALGSVLTI